MRNFQPIDSPHSTSLTTPTTNSHHVFTNKMSTNLPQKPTSKDPPFKGRTSKKTNSRKESSPRNYEKPRLSSAIKKSLAVRMEIIQKFKETKKKQKVSNIDHIGRKSLNKTRERKLSQEMRESDLDKELRSQELVIHKQKVPKFIRSKKKKTSLKLNTQHYALNKRSESCCKVDFVGEPFVRKKKKRRSTSIGSCTSKPAERKSDPLVVIHRENLEDEEVKFQKPKHELKRITDLNHLSVYPQGNLDYYIPNTYSSFSKSDRNQEKYVNNIEVYIGDSENLYDLKNSENASRNFESSSEDESNCRVSLLGLGGDDYLAALRANAASSIQRHFRAFLIKKYLKKNRIKLQIQQQQSLKVQAENKVSLIIQPRIHELLVLPITSRPQLTLQQAQGASIWPKPKPILTTTRVAAQTVRPIRKFRYLRVSTQYRFSIYPDGHSKAYMNLLQSQIIEQMAWNCTQVQVIDEIHSQEISFMKSLPDTILKSKEELIDIFQRRSAKVMNLVKDSVEPLVAEMLENLTAKECTAFEKNKKKKAENVKNFMEEFAGVCSGKGLIWADGKESVDGEVAKIGIRHSKIFSKPHDQVAEKTSKAQEDASQVSFQQDIEVRSVEFINNEANGEPLKLNRLPMLQLEKIQSDESIVKEPGIVTHTDSIIHYIRNIFNIIDLNAIAIDLKVPLNCNLSIENLKIQEKITGTPTETRIFDFPQLFDINHLLENEFNQTVPDTTLRAFTSAEKIHKKMLLSLLNYLLQQFRPYKYRGKPLPWSTKRILPKTRLNFEEIIDKVCGDFEIFSLFQIGKIIPQNMSDSKETNEDIINDIRADRLERLIYFEMREEEEDWLDYEFEETQTKFDVSDMILEQLADEAIEILNKLKL